MDSKPQIEEKGKIIEAGGPNWRNDKKPQFSKELDPSNQTFSHPDFGFEDSINLTGKSIWTMLFSHI